MCVNTQLAITTKWILAIILFGALPSSLSLHNEWKSHLSVMVYRTAHDVQPATYLIPEGTANATWTFQGLGHTHYCTKRQMEVHLQHGSLPPIAFRNESFPEKFFLNRTDYAALRFPADNSSHSYTLLLPRPGPYFTFTFITKIEEDERLLPGGLNLHCSFRSWMFLATEAGAYTEIPTGQEASLHVPPEGITVWFELPKTTVNYTFEMEACTGPCDLQVTGPLVYGNPNSSESRTCSGGALCPCTTVVKAPDVEHRHYFRLTSEGSPSDVKVIVNPIECTSTWRNSSAKEENGTGVTTEDCLAMPLLDRWQAQDIFHAHFVRLPQEPNVPDNISLEMRVGPALSLAFQLHPTKDTGTTLTIALNAWQPDVTKDSQQVKLCGSLLKGKVMDSSNDLCSTACHRLSANSSSHLSSSPSSADTIGKLHVPFPESGLWYLTLKLSCYSLESNGSERVETCAQEAYNVSLNIEVDPCLEGHCSARGHCAKLLAGTDLIYFSACDCQAGYQGYACTDDSEIIPHWEQLVDALLLSCSNLLFLPVIAVALRRGFYTEAAVYAFNMFFSTFYHACDRNGRIPRYSLCIMDYGTMQYADFMASTTSVWFTFMAATRISPAARSVYQAAGILCFALIYSLDKFNFWNNLGAGLVAGAILTTSWVLTCRQRRSCYPSKKRYLFSLLPGVLLSVTAILVYMFAETNSNYKYTHSFWHAAICISVLFFLPRKPLNGKGAFPVDSARRRLVHCCSSCHLCSRCRRKTRMSLDILDLNSAEMKEDLRRTGSLPLDFSPVLLHGNSTS